MSAEFFPIPEPLVSSSLGVRFSSESTRPAGREHDAPGGDPPLCFIEGSLSCPFAIPPHLPPEPAPFPLDAEPLEDFEPDDRDEPPDLEPEADFLEEDPVDRLLDDLLEPPLEKPLFAEEDFEPPLFEAADRELLPPLDEDERELPLFDDEPPLEDELFADEPEDFRLDEPEEPLFDEPEDLLLLPPPDDFDEPLFADEPERPLDFLPEDEAPELFRDDDEPLKPVPPFPPAFDANAD